MLCKVQENGNLMALLAYIIRETDAERGLPRKRIRLIRVLEERMERVREEASCGRCWMWRGWRGRCWSSNRTSGGSTRS